MKRKFKIINFLKILFFTIIVLILTIAFIPRKKSADFTDVYNEIQVTTTFLSTVTSSVVNTQTTTIPHISTPACKSSALYCVDEEQILYNYNIDEKTAPASLTKLLTAAVAFEYLNPNEILTAGSEQYLVEPYSSLCGLQYGSTATLKDFIIGMLMKSGNDSAYTIAVSTARNLQPDNYLSDIDAVNCFCQLMNDFAKNIGMKNSNFVNPDGWDNDNQYTTVSDLIILAEYALKNSYIRDIVNTQYTSITFISGEVYEWTNSNLLLSPYSDYYCENAIGIKTGTTANAGNCLIGAFTKNDKVYISVVVGCNSDADRYELTLKLINSLT